MNLEAVYFISQAIAAVALVGSLVFVGVQLRLSRKMERASAQREVLVRVAEWQRMVLTDENKSYDTFVMGLADYENAPALTRIHVEKCLAEFVFICESALNMRRDGFFSDGTWAGIEGVTLTLLMSPGGSQWWQFGRQYIGSEIVGHIDARLAEIAAGKPLNVTLAPSMEIRLQELASEAASIAASSRDAPNSDLPKADLSSKEDTQ
ncbi:hypothetical protein [Altererythrobacter sp. MF3-039]|uniref:hypothetical protein n=1 Tax=Altererythrobacter sp. MF3-039 TaxID=3252901 RepID=UPI00390C62F4